MEVGLNRKHKSKITNNSKFNPQGHTRDKGARRLEHKLELGEVEYIICKVAGREYDGASRKQWVHRVYGLNSRGMIQR